MRHLFYSALLLLILTMCNKNSEPETPQLTKDSVLRYSGATFVIYQNDEYKNDSVQMELVIDNNTEATLKLFRVRFVPQMPVTVDLDVPSIAYTQNENGYVFSGDSIVPTMGGNPVERYMATQIQGSTTSDSIHFSLNFGTYPTRYVGVRVYE